MAKGTSFWKIAAGVGCGIVGAVFLMFAACSVLLVGSSESFQEGLRDSLVESGQAAPPPQIELLDWEWVRDGEWVEIKGQLRNKSDESVSHLGLQVSFLDDGGSLVERSTFVTNPITIEPGAIATFDYPEEWDSRMKTARLSMTLDGRRINYDR